MNSLNLLSARVLGQATSQTPSPLKTARSRSVSDGVRNRSGSTIPPKRSVSQHEIARLISDEEEKASEVTREGQYESAQPQDVELVDEKSPLITDTKLDSDFKLKHSEKRIWLVAKQLVDALTESLKLVLSTLAAPGVYIVRCLYDNQGRFSPLLPIRRVRRKASKPNGSGSTAHAVGLSGSSDPPDRMPISGSEKRSLRSNTSAKSEKRDAQSPTSSDSETDRTRQARQKPKSPMDDATPARRSIRIKLYNEDPKRVKRQKNTKAKGNADTSESVGDSQEAVAAANLKSPTSPASSLRLTKYPRTPAPPRPLIPRRQPSYSTMTSHHSNVPRKTLVIDLDETLIHSLAKGGRMSSGHMVEVKLSHPQYHNGLSLGPQHPILYYVHKRPYCDDFLRKVYKWFNLVVFTASVQEYADPVIDWLEQERQYFSARYYRQHCTFRNGAYIKDLSTVEPDLSRVVILDNSPLSYIFHEDNAIPIEGWINDPTDNDLLHLTPLLEGLQYVMDVRALLALRRGEAEAAH